jgi:hypothetical protein
LIETISFYELTRTRETREHGYFPLSLFLSISLYLPHITIINTIHLMHTYMYMHAHLTYTDRACSQTIVEELNEQERRLKEAEAKLLIEKQEAELLIQAKQLSAGSGNEDEEGGGGGGSHHDRDTSDILKNITRMKPNAMRTLEEKAWIALDALMHPDYYEKYTSEIELEEMKYDQAYQCWQINRAAASSENFGPLTAEEVERILSLPRNISSALPFLKNQEEIDMHRLLMK